MDSINKYLSYEQQIKNLENKGLVFPDDLSKKIFLEYLKEYNYSHFVLGLKNKLMFDENKKYHKSFTCNNLRYLFDIDRNISAILWKYFKSLELHFNSSLVKVLSEAVQNKTNTPYLCCLEEKDFNDIFSNLQNIKYYDPKTTLPFKQKLFIEEFFKNYDTVFWFDDVAQSNLDKEHDVIIKKIENSWIVNKFNTKDKKKLNWIYIQLFVLFNSLTFSQLQKIFRALNTSLKNKVIDEFSKNLNLKSKIRMTEKEIFELLDIFNKLRNALAHNGCMIKYHYWIKKDSKLFNFFTLDNPTIDNVNYVKLYTIDFVRIIEQLRGIKNKSIEKEILDGIEKKLIDRNKRDEISEILYQVLEDESHIKIPEKIKNIK